MRKVFNVGIALAVTLSAAQAVPARLHKLVGTAIASNGIVTAVPAGTTIIDSQTIKCAATTGCIVDVSAMVQVIANGSAGGWQICILVDGNQAGPGCPVQGTVPTSNYVVGNMRANMAVATGNHQVQTEIVMPSNGNYAAWQAEYSVYKN